MTDPYRPQPEHKFTFGLWTVGNPGRDPFGEPVRPVLSPVELVHLLAEVGAYGVNFHDDDLVPIDATPAERDRTLRDFRKALEATGQGPDGHDQPLRRCLVQGRRVHVERSARARVRAAEDHARDRPRRGAGAKVYVFWGGREGVETDASKDPLAAIKRYATRGGLRP